MPNATLVNFAAGETSPRSRGRFDLDWFRSSCEKMLNYIPEVPGSARYRAGFRFQRYTRRGNVARLIEFERPTYASYLLEITEGYMRIYKDGDLLSRLSTSLVGATQASPGVIELDDDTGFAEDDEVIISGVVGMTQLNGRQFVLGTQVGSTFILLDPVTEDPIDTTGYDAWTSGGTVKKTYEITAPYDEEDLDTIEYAQDNSTMYLTQGNNTPYKLTRGFDNSFLLSTFTRTNDPFTSNPALNVVGVTSGSLFDDFEDGLAKWDIGHAFMTTATLLGSTRGFNSDTTGLVPGRTSAAIACTQTNAYGPWEFDLVNSASAVAVADSGGTTFGAGLGDFGSCPAFARIALVYVDANNFYELRVYGTDCSTFRLYKATAGVFALVTTWAGVAAPGASTHIRVTRSGAGSWNLYQDGGASLGAVLDNTHTTTTQFIAYMTGFFNAPSGGGVSSVSFSAAHGGLDCVGIDNVYFSNNDGKTIISFASGSVPIAEIPYLFASVGGATQINGSQYFLSPIGVSSTAYLLDLDGADVDSSAWTAYTTGGTATPESENPIGVAFYEGRLGYFGTNQRPGVMFLSRSPDSDGNTRYDDFTGGINADHACFFALAPSNGQPVYISWGRGSEDYLFIGSLSGPFRVSGSGLDEAITPTSINARQFDSAGCEITMPTGGARVFFIQRGGVALRSIRYNSDAKLEAYDMMLNAEHFAESPLRRVVLQTGRPDILWVVREDGVLAGMTVQGTENIAGWHRQQLAGGGLVLDAQKRKRTSQDEQLWIVAQREIDGTTRCSVEYQADDVKFPDPEDFFTDADSQDDDLELYLNAVYRRQEEYIHLDSAGTYNGADRGVTASATLTPTTAAVATGVTFTASQDVFVTGDVGRELWKKPDRETGVGEGRATITGYTSAKIVTCEITAAFNNTSAIAAGDWYFTATEVFVPHLEGETVAVVIDGAVYSDGRGEEGPTVTVADLSISLDAPAAVIHVGQPYDGFLKTHNLELTSGGSGPAQNKPRLISEAFIRFLSTLGVDFGTDIYDLEEIEWRTGRDSNDRPPPVFSGSKRVKIADRTTREEGKYVVVSQRLPVPCVVQSIDLVFDTTEGS